MTILKFRLLSIVLIAMLFSGAVSAQTKTTETTDGDAAAVFAVELQKWESLLANIPRLQKQYAEATPAEQEKIRKEFSDLIAKIDAASPGMKKAAEAAYRKAPNADPKVTEFMLSTISELLQRDMYKEANRVVKLLLDNKCKEKGLHEMAGISAFCSHQFDLAGKLFEQAEQSDALSPRVKQSYADQIPDYKKFWKEELAWRKTEAAADDLPRVKFQTNKGDITLELFENEAPQTVGNFVNLVEKKYYDGLTFHRVIPGFMAQGGDPNGTGSGGPGYSIYCECRGKVYRKHFAGSLSMAKTSAPNTGGSQFFLTFIPTSHLNGEHTVFGRVIKGMDVLAKIQRNPSSRGDGPKPDKIVKATVLRKRNHPYVPTKVQ